MRDDATPVASSARALLAAAAGNTAREAAKALQQKKTTQEGCDLLRPGLVSCPSPAAKQVYHTCLRNTSDKAE